MNPEDAGKVLAVAAAQTGRTVGTSDIRLWSRALSGYDPRECAEAVAAHYADPATCDEYLLPGHVIGRVLERRRRQKGDAHTRAVLEDIARAKAEANPAGAAIAHRAIAEAIAARHPDAEETTDE